LKHSLPKYSPSNDKSCVNCGSSSRSIKARGYCARCYPILLQLEHTQRWNATRQETLRNYPKLSNYPPHHWTNEFPRIKEHTIRELKKRLLHFKHVEDKLLGRVNGFDIEQELRYLAIRAGAGRNSLSRCAGVLDSHFTWEQRKLLLKLLTEVSESIKWDGITLRGFEWHIGNVAA
jgi:hypothetical protein